MNCRPTRSGSAVNLSDRQGFDRRWYAAGLEAIYVPATVQDVPGCVQDALSTYGRDVKITSGRHCYENFVYNPGTRAVIDMSALNQVGYVPGKGYFVDAGCENWTVYRTLLNAYGKTLPAGSCYSVGAGGHITGGGYGLLSRLHGLTIDHLTAVDIVTWDAANQQAQMRTVSTTSQDAHERDLFWALCGAGCGNFGVIARYWFADLPDAPNEAALFVLSWDWADLTQEILANILALYADIVRDMDPCIFTLLKLNHQAARQMGLVTQIVSPPGTDAHAHRQRVTAHTDALKERFSAILPLRPLRRPLGGHPGMLTKLVSQNVNHLTYIEALQTLNGSGPNQFGKYKSAYMINGFPQDQVAAIWKWLQIVPNGVTEADMAQTLLQVDSYGGAINTVAIDATAVPQRSSILKLQYQTYWNNDSVPGGPLSPTASAQQQAHLDWINQFYAEVYASTGGTPDPARDSTGTVAGCYFNYPDTTLGSNETGDVDRALWLYFLNNLPRLKAIKSYWDPQDYFHHAQSIPPSA